MNDFGNSPLASVAARVRQLGAALEKVSGQLPMLAEAVNRIDADVDVLLEERSETGTALSRHDRELGELNASVKRLATQITWIERHIRASGTAPAADLDDPDPELSVLATTAEAGHRAVEELLTAFARAGLEATVAEHRDAAARYRRAVAALLDAAARLALPAAADSPAPEVRDDYLAARGARVDAARRVEALAEEAAAAARRLTEDDAERRRRAATITAGERAEVELLTRLRTRLAAAVGDGALLPAWLTDLLGPMPPAGTAQRWMDVAAGLLAYRLTYAVTDPGDALGDLPEGATGYRRRWHAELGRGLRELRRRP